MLGYLCPKVRQGVQKKKFGKKKQKKGVVLYGRPTEL